MYSLAWTQNPALLVWQAPGRIGWVVALWAAGAAVVLFAYRRRAAAPWPAAVAALIALRLLALTILALALLKPALVSQRDQSAPRRLVVLLDRSASMGVRDSGFAPWERVAQLAQLRLLPADTNWPDVDAQRQSITEAQRQSKRLEQARRDWDYAKLSGQMEPAAHERYQTILNELLQTLQAVAAESGVEPATVSAITNLLPGPAAAEEDKWLRRLVEVLRQAEQSLSELRQRQGIQLYNSNAQVKAAADELASLTRLQLAWKLLKDRNGIIERLGYDWQIQTLCFADVPPRLAPSTCPSTAPIEQRTHLGKALQSLRSVDEQSRPDAIVLISDGRATGGAPPNADANVPILALNPASSVPPADLVMGQPQAPVAARVDQTITLRVAITGSQMDGHDVPVELSDQVLSATPATVPSTAPTSRPLMQQKTISVAAGQTATIEFPVKMLGQGLHHLQCRAATQPGEATGQNNSTEAWVKVTNQKLHVTLLGGGAGWDFQYLRNLLARTPWVALSERLVPDGASLPDDWDGLKRCDVLVLHDLAPAALNPRQWDAVHQYIIQQNGALVMVAGPRHLPLDYINQSAVSDLLPFTAGPGIAWRNWPGEQPGYQVMPAARAAQLDALQLDEQPVMERWRRLPAVYHYFPMERLKTNVLGALLIDRDSQTPLATEARLGSGRVIFMGTDESWRWRYHNGEKMHERFWLQLLSYAAEPPYAASGQGVWFDAEPAAPRPGQDMLLRARFTDSPADPVRVGVNLEDGRHEIIELQSAQGPGRYARRWTPPRQGRFSLRLLEPAASAELHLEAWPSADRELSNLSADEACLRRLARQSDGDVFAADQLNGLIARINRPRPAEVAKVRRTLWDGYELYGLVLACFTSEWALRKRWGLL